jgi:hypothetical protein
MVPVSFFSLPGLMAFSKLVVCCENLVATERCARGTLHVRELCIKTVRKAWVVWNWARAKESCPEEVIIVRQATSGFHWKSVARELVEIEEVLEDRRLWIDWMYNWKRER